LGSDSTFWLGFAKDFDAGYFDFKQLNNQMRVADQHGGHSKVNLLVPPALQKKVFESCFSSV